MTRILAAILVLACFITVSANANSIETTESSKEAIASPSVPMTAEMLKRSDGSWVIVRLSTTTSLESQDAALQNHPELFETFERYRRALTRGDMTQLSAIWIMNPAERREMSRIADSDERFSVSISEASLIVDGDRATVSFLQDRKQSPAGTARQRKFSRRGMAAYDSAGAWDKLPTR